MEWSRDEMITLKMSVSWGDWAEEIASILSKDVAEVRQKVEALGLTIKSFGASKPDGRVSARGPDADGRRKYLI